VRPDGDIELGDAGHHFRLPPCSSCGGQVLKPDVVFFGDSVPKDRVERCEILQVPKASTAWYVDGGAILGLSSTLC
jgi:NAD-dependent SIR2 family protein deacetylase